MLTTGLHWNNGKAVLTLADANGHETGLNVAPGIRAGWQIAGARRCVGIWSPATRQRVMCPENTLIDPLATKSQCSTCERADPGGRTARDLDITSPRPFSLYLAWFGNRVMKVGITAEDRRSDRLAEQGALAFTWAGNGRLASCRRAEQVVVDSGLAPDRIATTRKIEALWSADPEAAAAELAELHRNVTTGPALEPPMRATPFALVDLRPAYGFHAHPARPKERIAHFAHNAVVQGRISYLVGRYCAIETARGDLFLDMRLLSGWPIHPTSSDTTGLHLESLAARRTDDQGSLF